MTQHQIDVAAHYDDLDSLYREVWGEHVHQGLWRTGRETPQEAVIALVDEAIKQGNIRAGDRVIDIGCGYGATCRYLAETVGAEVVGYTLSARQAEVARSSATGPNGPVIRHGDWLTNQEPAGVFNVALAIESYGHMPDRALFFREVMRVLKPGGRLVMCVWLRGAKPSIRQDRQLLQPLAREARMCELSTPEDIHRRLESAGFGEIGYEEWTSRVQRSWGIAIRRALVLSLTRPEFARSLLTRDNPNRAFAFTPFRVWLAFRLGAIRYGCFRACSGRLP